MQIAAAAAGAEVQEAAAACSKTQDQLASLEAAAAAFVDAELDVSMLKEVSEVTGMTPSYTILVGLPCSLATVCFADSAIGSNQFGSALASTGLQVLGC